MTVRGSDLPGPHRVEFVLLESGLFSFLTPFIKATLLLPLKKHRQDSEQVTPVRQTGFPIFRINSAEGACVTHKRDA
jgi:hypothetical protein